MAAVLPGCYPRIAVLPSCHLKGSSWNGALQEWCPSRVVPFKSGAIQEWYHSGVMSFWNVNRSPWYLVDWNGSGLTLFWNHSFLESFPLESFPLESFPLEWFHGVPLDAGMSGVLTGVFTASSCRYGDGLESFPKDTLKSFPRDTLESFLRGTLEWCRPGYHAGERTISCYGDTRSDLGKRSFS